MMAYENVRTEVRDGLLVLTIDRPKVLNALNAATMEEIYDVFAAARSDEKVKAVIVTGGGDKAFVAGADIGELAQKTPTTGKETSERGQFILSFIERFPKPVIAAINGFALGGGCELALACDFVLASDRARFGQPEINLGVFPPVAAYQLSRQLAPRKGLELLLSGDPIDAAEAERHGLINAVFPLEEFDARCEAWLKRIYKQSASSLRFAKRAFRLAQNADFDERLAKVERLYLEELMKTADATEGLNAFLEKRKPAWKGR